MSSMYLGRIKVSIFGQSHSGGIGVVVDGLPAGEKIDLDELQRFLNRRAPGQNAWSTSRKEGDQFEILSGLVDGYTCGAPLCAVIRNTNTRSQDYEHLKQVPRPGHADYTAQVKYGGFQDVAGGGHFSGRLTAPMCFAGGVCMQLLNRRGIFVGAHLQKAGTVSDAAFDPVHLTADDVLFPGRKAFPVISDEAGEKMRAAIAEAKERCDSVGGVIECAAVGVPAGLGDPMFDGMENILSRILFAIPAVKGVEFGDGFAAADAWGSTNNDAYYIEESHIKCRTNHAGGILGGITNGMPIICRCAIKPTPSIALAQNSVHMPTLQETTLEIAGRHDPCIAPRAVPVVEAAVAIGLVDVLSGSQIYKNE